MPFQVRDDDELDCSASSYSFSEDDDEYLQALKVLDAVRTSTARADGSCSRIRKRQSLTCLQDLIPSTESPRVTSCSQQQQQQHQDQDDGWGFYLDSQPARPPLFRPSSIMRSKGSSASRRRLVSPTSHSPPKTF